MLTRAAEITPEQRGLFELRVQALGYDASKLQWNEQGKASAESAP